MNLLDLPDDVLENILANLSYDEVSHNRLVCQRFNEISKQVLNHGFLKVEKFHSHCLKSMKSQLPRRESERRNHPLARHCDILTAIETRLSLLSSTFKKFIDLNICCFIPGKVLDETFRVLRYITTVQTPIRTHDVLQELRDLSSMAMEYFDEKIAPGLRSRHKETGPKINVLCTAVKHLRPSVTLPDVCKLSRFVNELAKRHNNVSSAVASLQTKKKELENLGKKVSNLEHLALEFKKKMSESEKVVAEQQITITQQEVKLFKQKLQIRKLTKLIKGQKKISYEEPIDNPEIDDEKKQELMDEMEDIPILQRVMMKRKSIQNQEDPNDTKKAKSD